MNRQHDIEGTFYLYGTYQSGRTTQVFSGYRPIHKIHDNYLSSGYHEYPDVKQLAPGESARVLVWFVTPDVYPQSIWVGRKLDVLEGPTHVMGTITVTNILNPVLCGRAETYSAVWIEPQNFLDRSI